MDASYHGPTTRRPHPPRPRLLTGTDSLPPQSSSRLTVPVPALSFTSSLSSAATSPVASPRTSPPLPSPPSPLAVRPPMSHSYSHSPSVASKAFSTTKSLPPSSHSPFSLTPQPSSLNVSGPLRLLMPTVRHTRTPASAIIPSPKGPSQKSPQSRLSRSRASSVVPGMPGSSDPHTSSACDDWIGGGCRFEVVTENIQLEGYQLYAVEKWSVHRTSFHNSTY